MIIKLMIIVIFNVIELMEFQPWTPKDLTKLFSFSCEQETAEHGMTEFYLKCYD